MVTVYYVINDVSAGQPFAGIIDDNVSRELSVFDSIMIDIKSLIFSMVYDGLTTLMTSLSHLMLILLITGSDTDSITESPQRWHDALLEKC